MSHVKNYSCLMPMHPSRAYYACYAPYRQFQKVQYLSHFVMALRLPWWRYWKTKTHPHRCSLRSSIITDFYASRSLLTIKQIVKKHPAHKKMPIMDTQYHQSDEYSTLWPGRIWSRRCDRHTGKSAAAVDFEVFIMTGDKDLAQCVTDKVKSIDRANKVHRLRS